MLPIPISVSTLSAWKAQLSPDKLENAESLTYVRWRKNLNFSPWKIVNKCVRERINLILFTSSAAAHDSARTPSTSWFQCRLSPHMRVRKSFAHYRTSFRWSRESFLLFGSKYFFSFCGTEGSFSVGNCWSSGYNWRVNSRRLVWTFSQMKLSEEVHSAKLVGFVRRGSF